MVRGRKGRMRAEEKGTLCCDSWMIICPPIRTVCEEIPSSHVCTSIYFSLSGSIEDNNNRRISVPHPVFFLFPLFSSFFFFLLEGSTGASRRSLNPFEFMTRKKSIGIVSKGSTVSSFARICYLTVSSTFALFSLRISPLHLPLRSRHDRSTREATRDERNDDKIIENFSVVKFPR